MITTKILCIDDDEMFGVLLQHIFDSLEGDKYEVIFKKSAKEGMHYLKKIGMFEFPRIIILDINMPDASGFQFIKAYQNNSFDINPTSIYLVTSTIFPEDQRKATAEPLIKDILTKPFNKASAEQIVKGALIS